MMAIPWSMAARACWKRCGNPGSSISPASGWYTPPRIFSSVDLPAPFSPIKPCTVPAGTLNDTSASARTPGTFFPILRNSSAGGMVFFPVIRPRAQGRVSGMARGHGSVQPHLLFDCRNIVPGHQTARGENQFFRLFSGLDPVVHVHRSFIAVALGADQHGAEKSGDRRLGKLVQRRFAPADADADDLVGLDALP